MSHQDWVPVIWKKPKSEKKKNQKSTMVVANKQKNANTMNNTIKKVYNEEDTNPKNEPDIMPVYIDQDFSKNLQKKRLEKKLSQENLAKALSIPVAIINEYERGTGVRNGTYVSKIRKYLNF